MFASARLLCLLTLKRSICSHSFSPSQVRLSQLVDESMQLRRKYNPQAVVLQKNIKHFLFQILKSIFNDFSSWILNLTKKCLCFLQIRGVNLYQGNQTSWKKKNNLLLHSCLCQDGKVSKPDLLEKERRLSERVLPSLHGHICVLTLFKHQESAHSASRSSKDALIKWEKFKNTRHGNTETCFCSRISRCMLKK